MENKYCIFKIKIWTKIPGPIQDKKFWQASLNTLHIKW